MALAACLALGVSVWGTQSTAPAVLPSEDAGQSQLASSVPFPLPTVVEPARADSFVAGNEDSAGTLGPDSFFAAQPTEGGTRARPAFHRAVIGRAIPDAPAFVSGATTEVASNLPPADGI